MSLVAGCSLLDGILLAADCRVTYEELDQYSDNLQKIVPCTTHTAIGFVGSVGIAGRILSHVAATARLRKRHDGLSLLAWLPRFCRWAYKVTPKTSNIDNRVGFIVASSVPTRVNAVDRKALVKDVLDVVREECKYGSATLPGYAMELFKTDSDYVHLPGTGQNVLFSMNSPEFKPIICEPLQFLAMGSGKEVGAEIARVRSKLVASHDLLPTEMTFQNAIYTFLANNEIGSVGGLLTKFKVCALGVNFQGFSTTAPIGGTTIDLVYRDKRIVQRNASTGKEVVLRYPWEILSGNKIQHFDDLMNIYQRFGRYKRRD